MLYYLHISKKNCTFAANSSVVSTTLVDTCKIRIEKNMAKETFWQRFMAKYRVSILNENTLNEIGHLHLSRFSLFMVLVTLFLISFVLFACVIWFTPLKNYLPGFNENVRRELVSATERVDSLSNQLSIQRHYVDVIRGIVSGEVQTDTVQTLDSLAIIQREALLEEKSALTAEFMAEYEAKEKDYLTLFDAVNSTPVYTLFRPTIGVVEQSFSLKDGKRGITIRSPKNANITSVLAGTIVSTTTDKDGEWVILVQHAGDYISIYRHAKRVYHQAGDIVQAGETLGIVHDEYPLYFELWKKGQAINPEEVIKM